MRLYCCYSCSTPSRAFAENELDHDFLAPLTQSHGRRILAAWPTNKNLRLVDLGPSELAALMARIETYLSQQQDPPSPSRLDEGE